VNKKRTINMFFAIVFAVNLVVNLYIFFRTRAVFPEGTAAWWLSAVFFWLISFSYVIGRIIERTGSMGLAEPFITVGSWWLGAMVYLTLLFLLTDLLRGINGLFNATELLSFSWLSSKGKVAVLGIYALTAVILLAGYYNARVPVVREVSIQLNKPVPDRITKNCAGFRHPFRNYNNQREVKKNGNAGQSAECRHGFFGR
jgi:uncharacterized protein